MTAMIYLYQKVLHMWIFGVLAICVSYLIRLHSLENFNWSLHLEIGTGKGLAGTGTETTSSDSSYDRSFTFIFTVFYHNVFSLYSVCISSYEIIIINSCPWHINLYSCATWSWHSYYWLVKSIYFFYSSIVSFEIMIICICSAKNFSVLHMFRCVYLKVWLRRHTIIKKKYIGWKSCTPYYRLVQLYQWICDVHSLWLRCHFITRKFYRNSFINAH